MNKLAIRQQDRYYLLVDVATEEVLVKNASLQYIIQCAYTAGWYDAKIKLLEEMKHGK